MGQFWRKNMIQHLPSLSLFLWISLIFLYYLWRQCLWSTDGQEACICPAPETKEIDKPVKFKGEVSMLSVTTLKPHPPIQLCCFSFFIFFFMSRKANILMFKYLIPMSFFQFSLNPGEEVSSTLTPFQFGDLRHFLLLHFPRFRMFHETKRNFQKFLASRNQINLSEQIKTNNNDTRGVYLAT